MTTISKDAKLVTFINVFTVEPANQQGYDVRAARLPYLEQALTIAKFEPGLYEVVGSYRLDDGDA